MQCVYVYPLACTQNAIHYCLSSLVLISLCHSIHGLLVDPVATVGFSGGVLLESSSTHGKDAGVWVITELLLTVEDVRTRKPVF